MYLIYICTPILGDLSHLRLSYKCSGIAGVHFSGNRAFCGVDASRSIFLLSPISTAYVKIIYVIFHLFEKIRQFDWTKGFGTIKSRRGRDLRISHTPHRHTLTAIPTTDYDDDVSGKVYFVEVTSSQHCGIWYGRKHRPIFVYR